MFKFIRAEWEGRNAACFALSCQFRDAGYTENQARPHVLGFFGEIQGDGPDDLTEGQIEATHASAFSQPVRDPMPVFVSARGGGQGGKEVVRLGPVSLWVERPHVGPKKVTCQLLGEKDGERVLDLATSSTPSAVKEAARQVALHCGDKEEATKAVQRLLARARECGQPAKEDSGPSIKDIVRQRVPPALQIQYRTARGLWSEARGAELSHADLIRYTPSWLIEAVLAARDAPRGEDGKPSADLIHAPLGRALGVAFADLMEGLPRQENTEAAPGSLLASHFRNEVAALWLKLITHEQLSTGNGDADKTVVKACLASFVRSRAATTRDGVGPDTRPRWERVRINIDAWWRWYVTEADGECRIALAMTEGLLHQAGTVRGGILERVSVTAPSLEPLGRALGVFAKIPGVPSRTNTRRGLMVLAPDLTQELLAEPLEDEGADAEEGQEGGAG